MTHASISTLLQRLEGRGLVRRRKGRVGKAYLYSVTDAAEPMFRAAAGRLLERVFADDSTRLVASLFGAHEPSRQDLERLRALVDERLDEIGGGEGA